jgi:hypothetical protein
MNNFSCQYLTASIAEVSKLTKLFDSSLNGFDAANGIEIQRDLLISLQEFKELIGLPLEIGIKNYKFFAKLFGDEDGIYDHYQLIKLLVSKFGNPEKIQERIMNFTIGGGKIEDIRGQLEKMCISGIPISTNLLSKFIDSEDFRERQNNPEEVTLIRLSLIEIGIKDIVNLKEIINTANIYNLKPCPIETALKLVPKNSAEPVPINTFIGTENSLDLAYCQVKRSEIMVDYIERNSLWLPSREFVFCLWRKKIVEA